MSAPDITTDASYLALLKHIRNELAAKVEALPPDAEGRDEQFRRLEALADHVDDMQRNLRP